MDPIKTAEFLAAHPELAIVLILLLLAWPFAKFLLGLIDKLLKDFSVAPFLPQMQAFVLLAHFSVTLVAVVICVGYTSFHAPLIDPNAPHPLGPEAQRVFGYVISIAAAAMPIALLGRQHDEMIIPLGLPFLRPKFALAGVVGAVFVVYLIATGVFPSTVPASGPTEQALSAIWWYTAVPVTSLSISILAFGITCVLRGMWWLAGKLIEEGQAESSSHPSSAQR